MPAQAKAFQRDDIMYLRSWRIVKQERRDNSRRPLYERRNREKHGTKQERPKRPKMGTTHGIGRAG
jgi:hypothetical protein